MLRTSNTSRNHLFQCFSLVFARFWFKNEVEKRKRAYNIELLYMFIEFYKARTLWKVARGWHSYYYLTRLVFKCIEQLNYNHHIWCSILISDAIESGIQMNLFFRCPVLLSLLYHSCWEPIWFKLLIEGVKYSCLECTRSKLVNFLHKLLSQLVHFADRWNYFCQNCFANFFVDWKHALFLLDVARILWLIFPTEGTVSIIGHSIMVSRESSMG